jgi:hypothetical protein
MKMDGMASAVPSFLFCNLVQSPERLGGIRAFSIACCSYFLPVSKAVIVSFISGPSLAWFSPRLYVGRQG